jgi:hypothetical protein
MGEHNAGAPQTAANEIWVQLDLRQSFVTIDADTRDVSETSQKWI